MTNDHTQIEIELPPWLYKLWWLIPTLFLVGVGYLVSPKSPEGRPIFLSPQMARVGEYVDSAKGWTQALRRNEGRLIKILRSPAGDLFSQTADINQILGNLIAVQASMDATAPPQPLEGLHVLLLETVAAHLGATEAVANALNEPGRASRNTAVILLGNAVAQLDRVYTNPWLRDEVAAAESIALPTLIPSPTLTATATPIPTFTNVPPAEERTPTAGPSLEATATPATD